MTLLSTDGACPACGSEELTCLGFVSHPDRRKCTCGVVFDVIEWRDEELDGEQLKKISAAFERWRANTPTKIWEHMK